MLQGRVTDTAGLLTKACAQEIAGRLDDLERKTGAQLAVLIVPSIAPHSIEQFASMVFEKWKLGEKRFDNGSLVVAAIQDRRVRIEVGYGLEATIPDAVAGQIIDERIVPAFRTGRFEAGLSDAVDELVMKIESASADGLYESGPASVSQGIDGTLWFWVALTNFIAGVVAAWRWSSRWLVVFATSYALTLAVVMAGFYWNQHDAGVIGAGELWLFGLASSSMLGLAVCMLGWGFFILVKCSSDFVRRGGVSQIWSGFSAMYRDWWFVRVCVAIGIAILVIQSIFSIVVGTSIGDALECLGMLLACDLMFCLLVCLYFQADSSPSSSSEGVRDSHSSANSSRTFSGKGGSSGGGGASGHW